LALRRLNGRQETIRQFRIERGLLENVPARKGSDQLFFGKHHQPLTAEAYAHPDELVAISVGQLIVGSPLASSTLMHSSATDAMIRAPRGRPFVRIAVICPSPVVAVPSHGRAMVLEQRPE